MRLAVGFAISFDLACDRADYCERRKREFAAIAAVGERLIGLVAGGTETSLESAMPAVARLKAIDNGPDDLGLGANGPDDGQRSGKFQVLRQQRDDGDLVGLLGHDLLPHDQPLVGRAGGDRMQWVAFLGPGVTAPQGLAIDNGHVEFTHARVFDSSQEAALEQHRLECGGRFARRLVAGNAVPERWEAPQKAQMLMLPQANLDELIRSGDRGAEQKQRGLRQRIQHFGYLVPVAPGSKIHQGEQRRRSPTIEDLHP